MQGHDQKKPTTGGDGPSSRLALCCMKCILVISSLKWFLFSRAASHFDKLQQPILPGNIAHGPSISSSVVLHNRTQCTGSSYAKPSHFVGTSRSSSAFQTRLNFWNAYGRPTTTKRLALFFGQFALASSDLFHCRRTLCSLASTGTSVHCRSF